MSAKDLAAKVVRPEVQAMHAYHVPDAAGMVKLDVMESPYRLPPAAGRRDRRGRLAAWRMNRYPVPSATELRALIREVMQVPAGCDVLLGNGSDECIQYITAALAREGAVVMAPAPSFAMFSMHALFYRLRFVGVPLREDFTLDTEAFLAAMAKEKPALVWIAFPNNPTGNAFPVADIERIIRAAPGLVVIDEAYQPFAGATFMPRLAEFENMVVMRTVSKIGMAGLRLGYVARAAGVDRGLQQDALALQHQRADRSGGDQAAAEQEGARRAGGEGAGGTRAPARPSWSACRD